MMSSSRLIQREKMRTCEKSQNQYIVVLSSTNHSDEAAVFSGFFVSVGPFTHSLRRTAEAAGAVVDAPIGFSKSPAGRNLRVRSRRIRGSSPRRRSQPRPSLSERAVRPR